VPARILDGKQIAAEIQTEVTDEVAEFIQNNGIVPCLAAVLVGENPASEVYVRNKRRACERVGMESRLVRLPASTSGEELLDQIARLNKDDSVHGILVQLPLPAQIRESRVLDAVHPLKDVDCFHPENVGRLSQGRPRYLPCTPHGVQQILHRSGIPAAGKEVSIIGRSDIVGKPLAMLLMAKDSTCGPTAANATVTVCHSRTQNLAEVVRHADIVVAAIGQPRFVTAAMLKPGATVIDVGINRTPDGLCGDVDYGPASQIAGAITPVPGGVGPLTISMLLVNTLAAARWQL
jgi:methylenetetrahydrofolate dehydrogenase (NADP+)/methenyltetrahydrofolate cyclohydrolase